MDTIKTQWKLEIKNIFQLEFLQQWRIIIVLVGQLFQNKAQEEYLISDVSSGFLYLYVLTHRNRTNFQRQYTSAETWALSIANVKWD